MWKELHDIREVQFGTFLFTLHYYSEDKKSSMDFSRITCFKESKNMAVEWIFKLTINFYKKLCLPVIKWNKKYLFKQIVRITYPLEETFLFKQSKKLVVYFGLCESSLVFQRRKDQII